ncbi:hypothetical protein COO20_08835 [Thalassospira marina]|uniref:Uncharacterized protein n=1 Tax=Thalassospira marina TaxID=2048283 RepID=A0A2N3KUS9_9PROT|nr:hypothetical protein COO20_08835 [Thalassospira marina]
MLDQIKLGVYHFFKFMKKFVKIFKVTNNFFAILYNYFGVVIAQLYTKADFYFFNSDRFNNVNLSSYVDDNFVHFFGDLSRRNKDVFKVLNAFHCFIQVVAKNIPRRCVFIQCRIKHSNILTQSEYWLKCFIFQNKGVFFTLTFLLCCGCAESKKPAYKPQYSGQKSFPVYFIKTFSIHSANKKRDNGNAANDNAVQPIVVFFNHLISPTVFILRHFSLFMIGRSSCLKGVAYV